MRTNCQICRTAPSTTIWFPTLTRADAMIPIQKRPHSNGILLCDPCRRRIDNVPHHIYQTLCNLQQSARPDNHKSRR